MKTVSAVICPFGLFIYQMDVDCAFFNESVCSDIFVSQLKDYNKRNGNIYTNLKWAMRLHED